MKNSQIDTDIIIIRGAPGIGKTELGKYLSKSKFFSKGVKVEIDALRSMIIDVHWTNQDEHVNVLHLSTKLVCDFLSFGYSPIIVIDTFSGNKISKYIDDILFINSKLYIKIFSLYASDEELVKRIDSRDVNGFKNISISKHINRYIQENMCIGEFKIDTTNLSQNEISEIIINILISNNS
jgi:broad-specificity NMP kinase